MSDINWAVIGDIHSQSQNLERAIRYCKENNLRPLFLGDIFDSRCATSDSFGVYKQIRMAQETLGAIVLQSNHQDKLIRFLKGNEVNHGNGLDKTLDDFKLRSDNPLVNKKELLDWLNEMPYGIVFRDSKGVEYRACHAYFSNKVSEIIDEHRLFHGKDYFLFFEETFYNVDTLTVNFKGKNKPKKCFKKIKDEMICGPIDRHGDKSYFSSPRLAWWNNEPNRDWIMMAGHYHLIHYDPEKKSIILDSGCGDKKGRLTLFHLEKKLILSF